MPGIHHKSINKGEISEATVILAMLKLGYRIVIPFGSGTVYDFLVEVRPDKFLRFQVKTGNYTGGSLTAKNTHGASKKKSYVNFVDYIAIYSPDFDKIYIVDPKKFLDSKIILRVDEYNTKTKVKAKRAKDYEFSKWKYAAVKVLSKKRVSI